MALQGGWACRVRLCHYRKNSTSFWNDVSLSPVKDRLGRVTSMVWTMSEAFQHGAVIKAPDRIQDEDIAVRRTTRTGAPRGETRLDLAVQIGHVGFFELDHRTDSLSWSPILRDIYGVGTDEPASWQRYLELVHPDDRNRVISMVQRACAATGNSRYEVEHRLVRPDGAYGISVFVP